MVILAKYTSALDFLQHFIKGSFIKYCCELWYYYTLYQQTLRPWTGSQTNGSKAKISHRFRPTYQNLTTLYLAEKL